jgi:hypothetical protein
VPPSPAARLRALYFLYYGNVGTYLPFFAVYLQGMGFSGQQIGVIQMLPSFPLAPVVAVAWATYADHRATPQAALDVFTEALTIHPQGPKGLVGRRSVTADTSIRRSAATCPKLLRPRLMRSRMSLGVPA